MVRRPHTNCSGTTTHCSVGARSGKVHEGSARCRGVLGCRFLGMIKGGANAYRRCPPTTWIESFPQWTVGRPTKPAKASNPDSVGANSPYSKRTLVGCRRGLVWPMVEFEGRPMHWLTRPRRLLEMSGWIAVVICTPGQGPGPNAVAWLGRIGPVESFGTRVYARRRRA